MATLVVSSAVSVENHGGLNFEELPIPNVILLGLHLVGLYYEAQRKHQPPPPILTPSHT